MDESSRLADRSWNWDESSMAAASQAQPPPNFARRGTNFEEAFQEWFMGAHSAVFQADKRGVILFDGYVRFALFLVWIREPVGLQDQSFIEFESQAQYY